MSQISLINSIWLVLSLFAVLFAAEFTGGASRSMLSATVDLPAQSPLIVSDENQAIPVSSKEPAKNLTVVKSPRHIFLTKRQQERHSFGGSDNSSSLFLQQAETTQRLYSLAIFIPAKNYYQASLQLNIAARAPPFATNS